MKDSPAPKAPVELRNHARDVWRRFWKSRVSSAADYDADFEALRHWILAVDEREKLSELAVSQPLIPGAHHTKERAHLVLNPLFRRIRELTEDINRSQEAFGMTPLSRFRLQLTYADAGQSMIEFRRQAEQSGDRAAITSLDDLDALT